MTTEPTTTPEFRDSQVGGADPGTGVDLAGRVTSRFERLVEVLGDFWSEDRTTTITRIAVACRLRERLPDSVPLVRGDGPGSPAVVVDGSIGVVVLDDEIRSRARRRLAAGAEHVSKLVVYEADPSSPTMGSVPNVEERLATAGLEEVSFVSGGADPTPGAPTVR